MMSAPGALNPQKQRITGRILPALMAVRISRS
jgi:hypothetical protein